MKYKELPEKPFTGADTKDVKSYIILHGSWGRPVAKNLEGKMVESGLAVACVADFRSFTHGRFIYTSQHLEDSAIVILVSPREKDIAKRTLGYLPESAKVVFIETEQDAPEAALDLLIKATEFFKQACRVAGVNPASPANPGKIDKRKPMWVPFMAEMKRNGPLGL